MTTPDPLEPAIDAAGRAVDAEYKRAGAGTLRGEVVKLAVRAAAPIIAAQAARAALLRAADSLAEQGINAGFYTAQRWLRHLAENGWPQ